jgi:sugar phosphate isomerase/epimerase
MAIHARVSVNPMTTIAMPLSDAIALWLELGTTRVGLNAIQLDNTGWSDAVERVASAGLDVCYLNYGPSASIDDAVGWQKDQAVLLRAVDAAAALGAPCVYLCTGSPGSCLWEEAVSLLGERLAPVIEHARANGVRITLEPCVSSRPELGFLHTVRDALDVAAQLDIGVCVDLYACWMERGLETLLRDHTTRIDLVQISDFVVGTLAQPNRWVPGDGDLPLGALLDVLKAAGYTGIIDLELLGPKIVEEGARSALIRGTQWLTRELDARNM